MFVTPRIAPRFFLTCSGLLALSFSAADAQPQGPPFSNPAPRKNSVETNAAPAPKARIVTDATPSALPAKADPLSAPEEICPVPTTGPLKLQDLIQLALFYNSDILGAQRKLEIARAKRLAATDLKNPQLRIGISGQLDVDVGEAYTERSTSSTSAYGSEFDRQFYGGLSSTDGADGLAMSRYQVESGNYRESRYRTVERRVTPGATVDRIDTIQYDSSSTNSSSSRNRNDVEDRGADGIRTKNDREHGNRTNRRNEVSRTTTYVHHRDTTTPERQWGAALRFPFPNFWEIRPKIAAAEAEIRAADYAAKEIENEIIAQVRALYEELSYYDASAKSQLALSAKRQELVEITRLQNPGKLAGAAGGSSKARIDAMEANLKGSEVRRKLARLTGLNDTRRIVVAPNFRHRVIDLSKLNQDYLLQMASVYRMDLQVLHAKNASARAQYAQERAARYPFLGYFQAGYGVQSDRAGRDATEWSVGFGIDLPFWSWLKNKAEKVPEAEARALSREIGRLQGLIEADITSALQSLREAQSMLNDAEQEFAKQELLMKTEARLAAGFDKNPPEVVNESEEMVLQMHLQRLDMHRLYNASVQNLERALGTRLEKVLEPQK